MNELVMWILTQRLGVNVVVAAIVAGVGIYVLRNAVKSSIEEGVKFGFSKALEEHKAQLTQELESLKTSLKFSEARFSKQFEALVALRRYSRQILPKRSHLDMDWDEAMEHVADTFSSLTNKLEKFLFAHEAVLPTPVLQHLENALNRASDGQFEFNWDSKSQDAYARPEAITLAGQFYEEVKAAVKKLQNTVDEQMPSRKV